MSENGMCLEYTTEFYFIYIIGSVLIELHDIE
jgi:hypothetical protein